MIFFLTGLFSPLQCDLSKATFLTGTDGPAPIAASAPFPAALQSAGSDARAQRKVSRPSTLQDELLVAFRSRAQWRDSELSDFVQQVIHFVLFDTHMACGGGLTVFFHVLPPQPLALVQEMLPSIADRISVDRSFLWQLSARFASAPEAVAAPTPTQSQTHASRSVSGAAAAAVASHRLRKSDRSASPRRQ